MAKIKIPGNQDIKLRETPLFKTPQFTDGKFLKTAVKEAILIKQKRDGTKEEMIQVKEDQIIELTFEDDVTWYVDYESLKEKYPEENLRGALTKEEVLDLSNSISINDGKRGLGGVLLKALRIIGIDLPSLGAIKFAEKIESKLEPGPGLYVCQDLCELKKEEKLTLEQLKFNKNTGSSKSKNRVGSTIKNFWSQADLTSPFLIFIHGTASNTKGSFGGLMQEGGIQIWKKIQKQYKGQILAFEHPTLSKSPLENACDLIKVLPKGIKIHLVTHSRGGLIGDILARSATINVDGKPRIEAFSKDEIRFFKDKNRAKDLDALKELNKLFKEKNISTERMVRVASPAAGTTLASGRFDLYLNTILNLLKKIPFLAGSQIFDFTVSLLLATVKKRMSPIELPGLEAMVPGSPLTRILNNPNIELESELIAITGSVKGGSIWRSFKVFMTTLYFREDHDFVVNTKAMVRGSRRTKEVFVLRERGPNISHFRYFLNRRSQAGLLEALEGIDPKDTVFENLKIEEPIDPTELVPKFKRGQNKVIKEDRPIVFLIPGLMGSHLKVKKKGVRNNKQQHIWVKILKILRGQISALTIYDKKEDETHTVLPSGLLGNSYGKLCEFLEETHVVYPFPYDWRLSLKSQGDELAAYVKEVLKPYKNKKPKIKFVAHSMGGLVVRSMMTYHKKLWESITENEGRLIMLGTPNHGSHIIPLAFMGKDKIIKMLNVLDFKHNLIELLGIFTRYPGLLEMLPIEVEGELDYFDTDTWVKLKNNNKGKLVVPKIDDLKNAAKIQKTIFKQALDPKYVSYIAGEARQTPNKIEIFPDDKRSIKISSTSSGDGRVTWKSGIPDELINQTWYMPAEHGKLCNHESSFEAILELLEDGTTQLLSQTPPTDRGIRKDTIYLEPELEQFPDLLDLESAAIGYEPIDEKISSFPKTIVSIAHGDLGHARFPVAVGHHLDDKITSAEKALDLYLNNELSDRYKMGSYPEHINSCEIVLLENNNPSGGIIMGLGQVGELNRKTLKSTFYSALSAYVFKRRDKRNPKENGVSSLLIGGDYSGLNIKVSMRAILSAVQEINQKIDELNLLGISPILEFEFVEIYEDRAIEAAKILSQILEEKPLSEGFKVNSLHIRRKPGGRRKVVVSDREYWWHQLKVESVSTDIKCELTHKKDNSLHLKFTSLTDRARAEVSNLPTQKSIVDDLIKEAVLTDNPNPAIIKAIFELLIPNDFKKYSQELKNMVWIVDHESAKYPWELLQDSIDKNQKPIAVRAGMIRQLAVSNYRINVNSNAAKGTAFVVGDTISDLPCLKGAQDEAKAVATILNNNGIDPELLLRKKSTEITTELLKKDYQIIHLAGHGEFDPNDISRTGMVLGENTHLTPGIIDQLRTVPELVFINCCHLGMKGGQKSSPLNNHHKLAANLGTQLIEMGVKAVVVAGWAIDDAAAKTFAKTFYQKLFSGDNFGEAVQKAREKTYDDHSSTNTWGAYQCYGNPNFKIRRKTNTNTRNRNLYVDPVEVIIELENIANSSQVASSRNLEYHKIKVDQILEDIPKKWMKDGKILESLGNIYARLDEYKIAIDFYEQVKSLEEATYSVQLFERLANLKTKYGVSLFNNSLDKENLAEAKKLISDGISEVEQLINVAGKTSERLSLLGSGYKRLALVHKDESASRKKALTNAIKNYKEAFEIDLNKNGKTNYYPLINQAFLMALERLSKKGGANKLGTAEFKANLVEAKKSADERDKMNPNFWDLAAPADFCLLEILLLPKSKKQTSPGQGEEFIGYIKRAWDRGGSYFEKKSVEENLDFFVKMVDASPTTATNRILILEVLKNVQYKLSKIWEGDE